MKAKAALSISGQLSSLETKFGDYELPKVTVIIPTFNSANSLQHTIENVIEQKYVDLEVIIIDAGSTDKTAETIKNFRDERIRVYTSTPYQCYAMMNQGITHATGEYICFLLPGDHYTYIHTLRYMMALALENGKPDMVFCGTLLRDGRSEVKLLYSDLSLKLLRKGSQPTSLQSCWIRLEAIRELGKFDPRYQLRGGYDFFCRFALNGRRTSASSRRFYLDYDMRSTNSQMVVTHFLETFRIVLKHFGFIRAIQWLGHQRHIYRFFKLWGRRWRVAFLGK